MSKAKTLSKWLIGVALIGAGVNHFLKPHFYTRIMPPYIPRHLELVYISGVFEILGGLGLLIPKTQRWAGYGLIGLLLAVFPANIYMAQNTDLYTKFAPASALYLRLPLQFVLIAWIYWSIQDSQDSDNR